MRFFLLASLATLLLSACSTTTMLKVTGRPGTVISDASGQALGTIRPDGTESFKIDRKDYYAFLLAREPGAQYPVPFAMDFNNASFRAGLVKTAVAVGGVTASVGLLMEVVGARVGSSETTIGGLIAALAGLAVATPCALALERHDISNGYRLHENQTLNNDLRVRTSGSPTRCNIPQNSLISKPKASVKKRQVAKPQEVSAPEADAAPTARKILLHQSKEEAVAAAKKAIQDYDGILELRRTVIGGGLSAFDLYDGQTLIERHTYVESK
ncbi:MAG: hypothetical protein J5871_05600 [Bacteroidales bacterium]|nr:hypothetical protein [Bacteroidales bacterium]